MNTLLTANTILLLLLVGSAMILLWLEATGKQQREVPALVLYHLALTIVVIGAVAVVLQLAGLTWLSCRHSATPPPSPAISNQSPTTSHH
jgi:hypothetical protein